MKQQPTFSELPDHARVLTAPGLWLEGNALQQLGAVARQPGCVRAVGLPDLHAGPGVPIGAAFAFRDVFRPGLVGGDAGCGVRVVCLSRVRARGDDLERRVRAQMSGPPLPEVDPGVLLSAVWRKGTRGLIDLPGVPHALQGLAEREAVSPEVLVPCPDTPELGHAVGSIGGGNHFLEASRVAKVVDKPYAKSVGLTSGGFAVVAHSGSRGVGGWLSRKYGNRCLDAPERELYLAELRGAVHFAQANRLVLAWRMLQALGVSRAGKILGSFDVTHNTVVQQQVDGADAWVFRKGSAPAALDEPTIVLGSRGTPSWVMRGCGNTDCLCSVAHGAGRKMARSEAVAKLKMKYKRAALTRTALGGRVICDDNQLLYAEHPDAYKDVDIVVQALENNQAATRVASLEPLVTVKK